MEKIGLNLDEKNHGAFVITEDDKAVGQMEICIQGTDLVVYHTEVAPHAEGKGYAKKLLRNMVDYARSLVLKVIPLCPFVHAQFKRHPQEYADVWKKPRVED